MAGPAEGRVPAIHVFLGGYADAFAWMAGTSPAMTSADKKLGTRALGRCLSSFVLVHVREPAFDHREGAHQHNRAKVTARLRVTGAASAAGM